MVCLLQQSGWRIYFVAFLSVVAVVLAARFGPLFRAPVVEQGDYAVNALQIRDAKHLHEIYGNYSRYEFNHPGPAFFYVYAGAEALLYDALHVVPSPANAHLIAIICLQSFFLITALAVLQLQLRWRAFFPLAFFVAVVLIGLRPDVLVSVWPPHVLAMPFLCFLAACTCLASGRWRFLPIAVLAGGFLFHGHVAQPLFVGTLGLVAVGLGLIRQRRKAGEGGGWATYRWPTAIAGALAALFLLPLLLDVLTLGAKSNVAAILGRFTANTADHATLRQSILYFVSYPIASREQDTALTSLGAPAWSYLRAHGAAIGVWLAVLIVPSAVVVGGRRRLGSDERRLLLAAVGLLGVAILDCILWGMAQSGGVRHYNGFFYYAVYFFALLLALAWLARGLERRWWASATPVVCLVALVVLGARLRAHPDNAIERGIPIEQGVSAALASSGDLRPKLLVFDLSNWHIAAAVALELSRRGIGFYVPHWWSFMFKPEHDALRLGPDFDRQAETWWLAPPAQDGQSITSNLAIYRHPAPLDPRGGRIDFSRGGNAFRYVITGIRTDDFIKPRAMDGGETNEPSLRLRFVPTPADHDVQLSFEAQANNNAGSTVEAEVFFDDQRVGIVSVGDRRMVTVVVPSALWDQAKVGTLEIRFPQAVSQRSRARPNYVEWLGWRIWAISARVP